MSVSDDSVSPRVTPLGSRIKTLRGEQGLTQSQLADRISDDEESGDAIHASAGYIALIESGKRIPTEAFMAVLERALGVAAGSLKESRSQALVERIDGDFLWTNPDGGVTIVETKKLSVERTPDESSFRVSMPIVQYGKEMTEWMVVVMERARGLTEGDRQRVIGYIDALLQHDSE